MAAIFFPNMDAKTQSYDIETSLIRFPGWENISLDNWIMKIFTHKPDIQQKWISMVAILFFSNMDAKTQSYDIETSLIRFPGWENISLDI